MAIKITIQESTGTAKHSRVTVVRDGVRSSGLLPHDPDEDDILELEGDPRILNAAAASWDGIREEWELTDEELEEQGDGHWSARAG